MGGGGRTSHCCTVRGDGSVMLPYILNIEYKCELQKPGLSDSPFLLVFFAHDGHDTVQTPSVPQSPFRPYPLELHESMGKSG
jgi:hypothetical protein